MSLPIVGARHRPPANAILQSLPSGALLYLRPEPDNQYDSNAIKVVVKTADIPPESIEELDIHLPGYGMERDEIEAAPEWHLGYIPARIALNMKLEGEVPGTLCFDAKGWPGVETERPESEAQREALCEALCEASNAGAGELREGDPDTSG